MIIPSHAELNQATLAPAFIDPLEIPVLCKYAAQAQRIVEIGCAFGGSTVLFLLNMREGAHLSSIDPFVPDSMGGWQATAGECVSAVYRGLTVFGKLDAFAHWSLIPQTSEYVATRWEAPTPIDLLLIDGDHNAFAVAQDWILWSPHVRKGGIILLHDSRRIPGAPDNPFPQGWPGPTALAAQLQTDSGYKLVDEVFSLTCWEKQ